MKTILLNALIASLLLWTNTIDASGLKVIECSTRHIGSQVELNMLLECSNIAISANEQLAVQPVLINNSDTLRLPSLLFTGNTRDKVNRRMERLAGEAPAGYADYNLKKLAASGHTTISYSQRFPFLQWMYGSRLILESTVTGCAECQRELEDIPLSYIPRKLAASYIVPRPEQKIRHKDVSLYLNFHQGQSEILPDYMNNRTELAKTDSLINELADDPYIMVDSITITGYASPEGNYDFNTRLSGSRALALKNYLERKYTPHKYVLTTITASEDWEGLRKEIARANIPYGVQLMSIIDSIADPDVRDNHIRQLDNGKTYAVLLRDYYPPLRRVVCDAGYTVKPFTTGQAKQRLSTHPEQLSLNEMYLIAQSYPAGSPQFNELFARMLTLFPDNEIARNNLAAAAIESEDNERAKNCLKNAKHSPAVLNNLGILFFREGKTDEAKHCFEKASSGGCKEAIGNLQEINILMATQ